MAIHILASILLLLPRSALAAGDDAALLQLQAANTTADATEDAALVRMTEAYLAKVDWPRMPSLTYGGVMQMINAVPGINYPPPDPEIRGLYDIKISDFLKLKTLLIPYRDYRAQMYARYHRAQNDALDVIKRSMEALEQEEPPVDGESYMAFARSAMASVYSAYEIMQNYTRFEVELFQPHFEEDILANTDSIPATLPRDWLRNWEVTSYHEPLRQAQDFEREMRLDDFNMNMGVWHNRVALVCTNKRAEIPMLNNYDRYLPTLVRLTMWTMSVAQKEEYIRICREMAEEQRHWIDIETEMMERADRTVFKQAQRLNYDR